MDVWKYRWYKDMVKTIKKSFEIAFDGEPVMSLKEANSFVPIKRVYFILRKRTKLSLDMVKVMYLEALEQYIEDLFK